MGEQKQISRTDSFLLVDCGTCRTSFRLNVTLMKGLQGIRVRCRKCGASIDVGNPAMPSGTFLRKGIPGVSSSKPFTHPSNNPAENRAHISTEDLEKVGRVSPDYVASRAVDLDPEWLARNRCVVFDTASPEAEFYRVLRTRILHRTEGIKGVTVMVTSALPGEGKTTTAINLAFTFAKSYGKTVLLVDADLKQQRIREVLDFENDKGLADYLLDSFPLSDAIVWPGYEKLTILSGGRTVPESSELLGSPGMKFLVEEMKSRYPERYVIFDVAPVLVGADALAFAPLVDCILFVVQAGRTSLQDVNRAIRMLPQEKILGLVLNRDPHAAAKDYSYKYKK
jgi:protein-tyrosine kinase